MLYKTKILVVLLLLSINLIGCKIGGNVILHPIDKTDIFPVSEGAKIIQTDGEEIIVVKNGWFISDKFLKEIAEAKIDE